jgi:hypothetical protein
MRSMRNRQQPVGRSRLSQGVVWVEQQDDRDYHVRRARAELDAAYRARSLTNATAHLRLCSMHMQRARELNLPPVTQPVAIELDWMQRCAPLHEKHLAYAEEPWARQSEGPQTPVAA